MTKKHQYLEAFLCSLHEYSPQKLHLCSKLNKKKLRQEIKKKIILMVEKIKMLRLHYNLNHEVKQNLIKTKTLKAPLLKMILLKRAIFLLL